MSSRGEYRSVYVSLWDDDDFIELPKDAKNVLRYLKDTLGPLAIGKVSDAKAAALIGMTRAELEDAYRALEAPKAGRALGWIVRERGYVWVVNGLRYEPTLNPQNTAKHVPFVRRLADDLDASLAIVARFRAYYAADWLGGGGASAGSPTPDGRTPTDSLSVGNGKPTGRVAIHSDSDSDSAVDVDATGDSDSDASQRGSARDAARLASLRRRLLDERYGTAPPERRAAVEAQLDAVLTPEGATIRRGEVVRATPAVLAQAIELALGERIRNPDVSIVVVLKKCQDGRALLDLDAHRRTPSEAHAASEKAARQREERAAARVAVDVDAWCAAHPDAAAAFEREIAAALDAEGASEPKAREYAAAGMLATKIRAAMAGEREVAHA